MFKWSTAPALIFSRRLAVPARSFSVVGAMYFSVPLTPVKNPCRTASPIPGSTRDRMAAAMPMFSAMRPPKKPAKFGVGASYTGILSPPP